MMNENIFPPAIFLTVDTTTDLTADHMDRPRPKEVGTSPPQLPGPESTTHPKNGEQE